MKKNSVFLLFAALVIAGCGTGGAPVEYADEVDCINCDGANMVEFSMPNGNDLKLETAHHVIQVDAKPGKSYNYYVWTGDKTYDDDPDLIIEDGTAAVLVEE